MTHIPRSSSKLLGLLLFVLCSSGFRPCKSNKDCSISGCICGNSTVNHALSTGTCQNPTAKNRAQKNCKTCSKDSNCDAFTGSVPAEYFKQYGVCIDCFLLTSYEGAAKCAGRPLKFCKTDANCSVEGCSCLRDSRVPFGVCGAQAEFIQATNDCETCHSNADCGGGECPSDPDVVLQRRVCTSCTSVHEQTAISKCFTSKPSPSPTATPSSSASISPTPKVLSANKSAVQSNVACVSTHWLYSNGMTHRTIGKSGFAPVLCIAGLPCATYGHLIRDSSMRLITYREACDRFFECVRSEMEVSQLRHNFNWSLFRSVHGNFSFTSLSAHPYSTSLAPSRIIARTAEMLNRAGMSFICDVIIRIRYYLKENVLPNAMSFLSGGNSVSSE